MTSNKKQLMVEKSFGVGNFRQTAGFPKGKDHTHQYVCPLGPSVVVWDIRRKTKEKTTQLSSDLIACLIQNDVTNLILLVSYNGKGKILDPELKCICEFQIPGSNVVYGSWNLDGSRFSVATIGPKSIVAVYALDEKGCNVELVWLKYARGKDNQLNASSGDLNSQTKFDEDDIEIASEIDNSSTMQTSSCGLQIINKEHRKSDGELNDSSGDSSMPLECNTNDKESSIQMDIPYATQGSPRIVPNIAEKDQTSMDSPSKTMQYSDQEVEMADKNPTKQTVYECYYGCVFTETDTTLAIFKRPKQQTEIHILDKDGVMVKRQDISPLGESETSMMCLSSCRNGIIAVGLQRGIFVFMNCVTLEMVALIQAQGSSQVCIWDDDALLTASYQSGVLQWWNTDGELMKQVSITPIDSVIHLNWAIPGKELWIGGITSLNYLCLPECSKAHAQIKESSIAQDRNTEPVELTHTLMLHRLAGCGLDYKNHNILATGDLSGNIMIWDKSDYITVCQPRFTTNIGDSVRSLCWCNNFLFIGTLSGELFTWVPTDEPSEYKLAHKFEFSILTMKVASGSDTLAVGTSGGEVFVFDLADGNLELKLKKRVHAPMSVSLELEKQPIEIWSLSWKPDDRFIATASEDKTTIIIEAENGQEVERIFGHTTAVTSVDWKETGLGCLLVTCADDRTVRVHDGEDFTLLKTLKTDRIYGWYTLTYLSLNPIKNLVLCSTQNGFLIVWDLESSDMLVCERMHCGSIEGLSWDEQMTSFAAIGSACVANIFKLGDKIEN